MHYYRILLIVCVFHLSYYPCNSLTPTSTSSFLSSQSIKSIERGRVAIIKNWISSDVVAAMNADAQHLFKLGEFRPDGLTNTAAKKEEQGFTVSADRQTFRGGAGWDSDVGNFAVRRQFASKMRELREELAVKLNRPTLSPEDRLKHEMTMNWYEPGAKLGRHIDEHHEETKGLRGWKLPTRRSVTWLVYLNGGWREEEGGALRCFPRSKDSLVPVGAHEGNLQVGWIKENDPVFLDCFRESGMAALYRMHNDRKDILSTSDFNLPMQPLNYIPFLLPIYRDSFEQISSPRRDPRFAASTEDKTVLASLPPLYEKVVLDIVPEAGTLVLFDSVTVPHLVKEVTGKRQRIAATGWFHEDSQFYFDATA